MTSGVPPVFPQQSNRLADPSGRELSPGYRKNSAGFAVITLFE